MSPEERAALRQKHYNATVAALKHVHSDLVVMRVAPDFAVPSHKPGQYSTLGMGRWEPRAEACQEEEPKPAEDAKLIRRAYSLSCSVLDDAGQGDRVFLGEKIAGHYTLDPVKPGDSVVFLSTGTGEAPHNYMLWDLLRRGHAGRILSACCVRYRRDLAYVDLHDTLMRRHENYKYLALTTRETQNLAHKVYIQDLITSGQLEEHLAKPLDPATTHVFLCGNPKMIGVPTVDKATGAKAYPQPPGVIEILERRGFAIDQPSIKVKGNIHFEEYW